MRSSGITALDLLVQSHGDNDHIGGLRAIIDEIPITRIISGVPEQIPHKRVEACSDGQSWQWDGVYFRVLHPEADTDLSGNDRSCVLRISTRDVSLLLTGDIEDAAERRLVKRYRNKGSAPFFQYVSGLKSDVLVAPHHGSRTSSTPVFAKAVSPDIVIFPVGYRNRFKLPNQDIIFRYQDHEAKLLSYGKERCNPR